VKNESHICRVKKYFNKNQFLPGNYLSEHADEAKKILTAAKIISAPWDVQKGAVSIEKPYLNNMLNSHLAGALCNTVKKYDILFKEEYEWNMEKVLKSKTIKEFDSHFTSIHFGYGDVDNYYSKATMHNKLHKIKVPTLCLSAADDPFQPLDGNEFAKKTTLYFKTYLSIRSYSNISCGKIESCLHCSKFCS
jgi:predicted alpha/beta-fold hydrolase